MVVEDMAGPIRSGCGEYDHGCVDIGKMWLLITIGNWEPVPCPGGALQSICMQSAPIHHVTHQSPFNETTNVWLLCLICLCLLMQEYLFFPHFPSITILHMQHSPWKLYICRQYIRSVCTFNIINLHEMYCVFMKDWFGGCCL